MGVYLSSPVTEKESINGQCERFVYGASSMQGWRITQEDAHNCIPLFDEKTNTSFFAVYDGHGGSEVAKYCEKHFPDFVKSLMEKGGTEDPASFIKNAFLAFDATLTNEDVIKELKELAGKDDDNEDEEDDDPVGHSETDLLKKEANMPLDQLLAQYKGITAEDIKNSQHNKAFQSPALRSKSQPMLDAANSSKDKENGPSSSLQSTSCSSSSPSQSVSPCKQDSSLATSNGVDEANTAKQPQTSIADNDSDAQHPNNNNNNIDSVTNSTAHNGLACVNNDKAAPSLSKTDSVAAVGSKSDELIDGDIQTGSGCTSSSPDLSGPARSSEDMPSVESDDGPSGSGASSALGVRTSKAKAAVDIATLDGDMDTSDDDDDDEEEEDVWEDMSDDDDDDDDEDDEDEEDGADEDVPMMDMTNEEPGSDSGCTACVVLMRADKLIVANAGDSRCILSRAGKAVDLSFDHKPEDDSERKRIENAGGKVTADGRVNGGLNLSRAIGDHVYKRNKDLLPEEQMITALPDIEAATLCNDDQFIVVACDGIWNYMSSQEVVDFVLEKLQDPEKKQKPSTICEELFDHCLAPNTSGDGTGCDNMTCIIIVLNTFLNSKAQQGETVGTVDMEAGNNCEKACSEKQSLPDNEKADLETGSLKRCTDSPEVREEKRIKVQEETA